MALQDGAQATVAHTGALMSSSAATESFFEQPHQLAARHPALYDEFLKYYRIDPRQWQSTPPAPVEEPPQYGVVYGQWR